VFLISSAIIVALWATSFYQGVVDPLGGINSLWPALRHLNQLLAAVALVVATTILMKMASSAGFGSRCCRWPWLVIITMSASYQKIFDANPRIGFLAYAKSWPRKLLLAEFPPKKLPKRSASFSISVSTRRSPACSPP